jgi:hypothetical protein
MPLQLSVVVTDPMLTAGMDAAHGTVTVAGQVIVGATLSFTVMICEHVAVLLQASVAR